MKLRDILERCRVKPGRRVRIADHDPGWIHAALRELGKDKLRQHAQELLDRNRRKLQEAQERLYAGDSYSLLIIFQALDAAGKDGTIKHVMSGVNPQGCQVYGFKRPSDEELDHNFLWRCMRCLPERGRIGIFNRSYYEEVLVVRVHAELLEHQKLPPGERGEEFWEDRYDDINRFERHLVRSGTVVLKFFLNVSKDEQKRRFLARLDDPEKHWKFSAADVAEREHWDAYMRAYEKMLEATSTKWAPWHVIPADHKYVTRALVAAIIVGAVDELKLREPKLSAEQRAALADARRKLLSEGE